MSELEKDLLVEEEAVEKVSKNFIPRFLGDVVGLLCTDPNPEGVKKKVYVGITYAFCVLVIVLSTISLVGSGFSAFLYYRF